MIANTNIVRVIALTTFLATIATMVPVTASASFWHHDHDRWRHRRWSQGYSNPGYYGNGNASGLLYARRSAEIQYQQALARGDRKAAQHLGNAIKKLDRQLAAQGYRGY